MELTQEQIAQLREALTLAQSHLYNDLDAICDEDYQHETETILTHLNKVIEMLENLDCSYSLER